MRPIIRAVLLPGLFLVLSAITFADDTSKLPLPAPLVDGQKTSGDDILAGKPVAMFGLYNCRGWAGVVIVLENGGIIGPLSMRPGEAIKFADKAGVKPANRAHMFPAQGECAKVSPYESQLRDQDSSTT